MSNELDYPVIFAQTDDIVLVKVPDLEILTEGIAVSRSPGQHPGFFISGVQLLKIPKKSLKGQFRGQICF